MNALSWKPVFALLESVNAGDAILFIAAAVPLPILGSLIGLVLRRLAGRNPLAVLAALAVPVHWWSAWQNHRLEGPQYELLAVTTAGIAAEFAALYFLAGHRMRSRALKPLFDGTVAIIAYIITFFAFLSLGI